MLYCEAELCLAASTFARGGILSENFKDGKVTVHSAKNTTKFDAIVDEVIARRCERKVEQAKGDGDKLEANVDRVESLVRQGRL